MSWYKLQTSLLISQKVTSTHTHVMLLGTVVCSIMLGEKDYLWGQACWDAG